MQSPSSSGSNPLVKDLMVPLDDFPKVERDATLKDAILALQEYQKRRPEGREPYRAVLVVDAKGNIVGKIGQETFVNALGVNYNILGSVDELASLGISRESITTMMENYRFFQESLSNFCRRARSIRARDVMRPIAESVDQEDSLQEAINKIGSWRALSVLVRCSDRVVGILRLSDVFQEIAQEVLKSRADCD